MSRLLTLMIDKQWTHHAGKMQGSRSLSLEGEGTFKGLAPLYGHEMAIGVKGFEHHAEMKSSTFVHFKDTIQHWQTGKKAKIEAPLISLLTQDDKALNQGLLKADQHLALSQNKFTNQGTIETSILTLKGEKFTNEGRLEAKNFTLSDSKHFHNKKGASLEVHDQTFFNDEAFLNEGTLKLKGPLQADLKDFKTTGVMTVEGLLKGTIETLINNGDLTLDQFTLEGETLKVQGGTFTVKDSSFYQGESFTNNGKVEAAHLELKASPTKSQRLNIKNSHIFHADSLVLGAGCGLINDANATLEVSSTLEGKDLHHFRNDGHLDVNQVKIVMPSQWVYNTPTGTFLIHKGANFEGFQVYNQGTFKLKGGLETALKTFNNSGIMTVEGLLKGTIETLINNGDLTLDQFTLEGQSVRVQKGTFTVKQASMYTGEGWYNDGKVEAAEITLKAPTDPKKWMDFRNRKTFQATSLTLGSKGGLLNEKGCSLILTSFFEGQDLRQFLNDGTFDGGKTGLFHFNSSESLRFGTLKGLEGLIFITNQAWQWKWLEGVKTKRVHLKLEQPLTLESPLALEMLLEVTAPSLTLLSELKVRGLIPHLSGSFTIGEAIFTPFPQPKSPSDAISFYDVKKGKPYLEVSGRRGTLESYGPVTGEVGSFVFNSGSFYSKDPVYIKSEQAIELGHARESYNYYSRGGRYIAYPYFCPNGTLFTCDSDCVLESLNNHILLNLASLIIKGNFYGFTPSGYPLTNWAGKLTIGKNAYYKGYGFDHLTSERTKSPYVRDRYPDGIDYNACYRQGGGAPDGSMAWVLQGSTTNDTLIADAPEMTVMGDAYWVCDYVHNHGGHMSIGGKVHQLPGTRVYTSNLPHSMGEREAILSSPYQIIIEESPHVKHEGILASPFILIKGQRVETPVTHELGETKPFVRQMSAEPIIKKWEQQGMLVPFTRGREALSFPYAQPSPPSSEPLTILISKTTSEHEKCHLRSLSELLQPEALPFVMSHTLMEGIGRNYIYPRMGMLETIKELKKNAYKLSGGSGFVTQEQLTMSLEALLYYKPGYYVTSEASGYWLFPEFFVSPNPQLLTLCRPGPKMVGEEVMIEAETALLQGGIYGEKRVQLLIDYLTYQKPVVEVEVLCSTTRTQGGLFGDKNKTTYRTEVEHRLQDTGWIKVGPQGGVYVQGKQAHFKGIELEVGEEGLHVHVTESFEAGPARGQYYVPYEASAEGFGSSYSERGSALQEVLAPFKLKVAGQKNEIVSDGVATLQATQIEGKGSQETLLTLKAPQAHLLSAKRLKTLVDVDRKGPNYVKTTTQQEVAHSNEIQGLTLRIEADHLEGVEPTLIQAVLDIQASLTKLISQDEFAATLKTLVHKQVVGSAIDPGLAMVVGLAAGLATCGWGSALMNSLAESMFGMMTVVSSTGVSATVPAVTLSSLGVAMADAGLSAICSQAASSLLQTGNLKEMSQDLTSSQFAKSLTITLASAGLMNKLSGTLKLLPQPKGWEQHLKVNAVRSLVSTPLHVFIGGQKPEEALLSAARMIVAGTLGGLGANEIAQLYSDGELDYLMHKIGHAFLCGGMGAILSDDIEKGLLSGGIGGFFGEIAGEELVERLGDKQLTTVLGQMDETVMKAQLAAAVVTALMGQDIGIAIFVAENAIRNNSQIVAKIVARLLGNAGEQVVKEGVKVVAKKGAEVAAKKGTKSSKQVAKLAEKVAEKTGGIKTPAKGEGYSIQIANGKHPIKVRIMEKGGERSTPYCRISVKDKGAVTQTGEFSSNRHLTHIELHKNSIEEIVNIIKILKN